MRPVNQLVRSILATVTTLAVLLFLFPRSSEAAPEYSFLLTPGSQSVTAGETGQFTIILNKAYLEGDAPFTISASSPTHILVSSPVVVPKGVTFATGQFDALKEGGPFTITAVMPQSLGGYEQTATVLVEPAAASQLDAGAADESASDEEAEAGEEIAASPPVKGSPSESAVAPTESASPTSSESSSGCASGPVTRSDPCAALVCLVAIANIRRARRPRQR